MFDARLRIFVPHTGGDVIVTRVYDVEEYKSLE